MADFLKSYYKTAINEGGYANNEADAGGETYCGIARHFWPRWAGWQLIDALKTAKTFPANLKNIPALSKLVLEFYAKNFWDANRLGEIINQDVADWLYDHAVNGGGRGIQWIQEAAGVTADGDIGNKTIAAINAADPVALLHKSMIVASLYRLEKAHDRPSQIQFLHSWLERDGLAPELIKLVLAEAKDDGVLDDNELADLKRRICA
ncbi:MAG: N-acetylmuramidase [Geobacteraceae bacterium]|nr:N-acetylmuramidase [Geobacteraceae bacterium]